MKRLAGLIGVVLSCLVGCQSNNGLRSYYYPESSKSDFISFDMGDEGIHQEATNLVKYNQYISEVLELKEGEVPVFYRDNGYLEIRIIDLNGLNRTRCYFDLNRDGEFDKVINISFKDSVKPKIPDKEFIGRLVKDYRK